MKKENPKVKMLVLIFLYIIVSNKVDLEDLYNGSMKELSIQKNIICPKCHGTGGKLGHTKQCDQCRGRGMVLQDVVTGMGFSLRMQNTCPKCKGKGIVNEI